ncbi:mechanosensitive ion channel protein 10-like [Andrographis paniculata]|uniref:mechanosensitive ion channel protein 10-like n=1 Tax=Andrographis paniculata TaxID=175694 RepID=UPI0021E8EF2C|nr:mechanosensitive ion channel protein 10-like [Andrographis paniculata]
MESEVLRKVKEGISDVVVEIKAPGSRGTDRASESTSEISNLELSELSAPAETTIQNSARVSVPAPADYPAKPPVAPAARRRSLTKSAYSKPKSRIAEPPYPSNTKITEIPQIAPSKSPLRNSPGIVSPSMPSKSETPKQSAPVTPKTPLISHDEDDEDDDNEVYKTENLKIDKGKRGKKVKVIAIIEWIAFITIMTVLIASKTINTLKDFHIWSLQPWKWCVLVLVIFCGHLFTEWLSEILVFLIEKNFLLKKKVLYFVFGMKKSIRIVIWLALILLTWSLLINRGVKRSKNTKKVLNYITRGIISTLIGAVLWMIKTLLVKLVASSFHVRTYFDRIQESVFHQYLLQVLSGPPMAGIDGSRISGQLSFNKGTTGEKKTEVINVDKLHKMKREKVSAWTIGGLIKVIRDSDLLSISEVLDESIEDEPKVITNEVEARDAANRIFKNVAKHGQKYIDEDDLLQFMPKAEVDNAFPLFEGAAESRRIKKSSFRNWVVKAYNERKYLAVSLNDAKTAIEELNKLASGLILVVIIIVWLLVMEIATTKVLVFISSQILLIVFMFGNTAKMVFEAIIFVFVTHPFDVGDRCVVDGEQMVVDEMNILSTVFLKPNNEKMYYPNSVLATKPISNYNRSPEMGDSIDFAVDFFTSVESIAALKSKIKAYLESKPQLWSPNHSVQLKEIVDVNKLIMALYVSHTINFQNSGERGNRRSELVLELKKILEEVGIRYRLLPQEVQLSYVNV